MKYTYAAIDIETSSLHPSKGQLLELGVVIDDLSVKVDRADLEEYLEQLPKFHCYKHPNVVGEHYAVSMHNRIWQLLAKESVYRTLSNNLLPEKAIVEERDVYNYLGKFLKEHGLITDDNNRVTVAGKNVAGFDIPWLKTLSGFNYMDTNYSGLIYKFSHRTIDPAMLYMKSTDKIPPSLNECLQRAGINKTVDHTAVGDALDVIRCLKMSNLYN